MTCDWTGCDADGEYGRDGVGLHLCDEHLKAYHQSMKEQPGVPLGTLYLGSRPRFERS